MASSIELKKVPCPCGCKKWMVKPLFGNVESTLYEEEADELIKRWNSYPQHVEALEWYAEPVLAYAITQEAEPRSAVHADGGRRARGALGRK